MTFENLHNDTDCNCTNNSEEDVEKVFARRISASSIKNADMKSHWERKKRPQNIQNCKDVCNHKGLSINEWAEISQETVIKKYLPTSQISPAYKKSICIFTFEDNAGKLSHSPSKKDPYHYTFYKSDLFSLELLNIVEVIPLANYV